MNYPPAGALDTEFYTVFMDDAESARAAYPEIAVPINDTGVYLFRTNGDGVSDRDGDGNVDPVPVQYASFPPTVAQGSAFTINNFAIENLGTFTVTPSIDWYLTTLNHSYNGVNYYLGTTTHQSLGTYNYFNSSRTLNVPCDVPLGQYYISAFLQSDDFGSNNAAWTQGQITVIDGSCSVGRQ